MVTLFAGEGLERIPRDQVQVPIDSLPAQGDPEGEVVAHLFRGGLGVVTDDGVEDAFVTDQSLLLDDRIGQAPEQQLDDIWLDGVEHGLDPWIPGRPDNRQVKRQVPPNSLQQ